MWKTLGGFWANLRPFGNILPSKNAQVHCGAVGLSFFRKPYIAVNSKQLELDSIFIQNPDLRPYFFEKKKIDKNDKNYNKAVSVADYTIDYFDLFYSQVDYFLPPRIDLNQKAFNSWKTYIKQSFKLSPILCQRLNEVKGWYSSEFVHFVGSECH
jgi:hypothetical protein